MAMQLRGLFYSMFKKRNSTAIPTPPIDSSEQAVMDAMCLLDEVNFLYPKIRLISQDENGGILPNLSIACLYWDDVPGNKKSTRWYFVENIKNIRRGLWELDLSIDVLATWKDEILTHDAFVQYSASEYDQWVEDVRIPTLIRPRNAIEDMVKIDKGLVSNLKMLPRPDYDYWYSITVADNKEWRDLNNNPTVSDWGYGTTYFLTAGQLSIFRAAFLDQNIIAQIINQFSNIQEAVLQIRRVAFLPENVASEPATAELRQIRVGAVDLNAFGYLPGLGGRVLKRTFSIDIPWKFNDYRDKYTIFTIYLPYFGVYMLQPSDIYLYNILEVELIVDTYTGEGTYNLYTTNKNKLIATLSFKSGAQQIFTHTQLFDMPKALTSLISLGATAAAMPLVHPTLAPTMMAGATISAATTTPSALQHSHTTIGSMEGVQYLSANQRLWFQAEYLNNAENPENINPIIGRPLYKVKRLSTLKGYTQCINFSMNQHRREGDYFKHYFMLGEERRMINDLMNTGIFIENSCNHPDQN